MAINHSPLAIFSLFFSLFPVNSDLHFFTLLLPKRSGIDFRHNLTVQQTEGGFMELRHPCTVVTGGDSATNTDPSAVESSSSTIARLKAIACEYY